MTERGCADAEYLDSREAALGAAARRDDPVRDPDHSGQREPTVMAVLAESTRDQRHRDELPK